MVVGRSRTLAEAQREEKSPGRCPGFCLPQMAQRLADVWLFGREVWAVGFNPFAHLCGAAGWASEGAEAVALVWCERDG